MAQMHASTPPVEVYERFGRLEEMDRSFDIAFWQAQGDEAIFEAASQLILDYGLMRGMDADELRLQRTVESFQHE